jgi:hypothetical protein
MSFRAVICVLVVCSGLACTNGSVSRNEASGSETETTRDLTRAQMDEWWQLYQLGDPKWPAARDRWEAASPESAQILVFSLVRELVRLASQRDAEGKLAFRKPQAELLALSESLTVPVLIEGVRIGKDRSAVDAIGDTLVEIAALDAVMAALESPREGDSFQAAPAFLRTLTRIGGARALGAIEREATSATDWQRRSAAVESLRSVRPSDRERAVGILLSALKDSDPFVVRTAMHCNATTEDATAAPGVAQLLAAKKAEGDRELALECITTLRVLTRRRIEGDDPARWAEVAEAARTAQLNAKP